MKLNYHFVKTLPPLAWYAEIRNGLAKVMHGEQVETNDRFFVDGAWSGNFSEGEFITADWFCGTGAKIKNDKIIFSTPTHVAAGLFMKVHDDACYLSNSLFLLMQKINARFDPQYLYYETDFSSIVNGIKKYKEHIHIIDSGNKASTIKILYMRNVTIDNDNHVNVEIKDPVAPFASFEDYYGRLRRDMLLMRENSIDALRGHKFGITATISKGYDAPCCAVITKDLGSDTVVTYSAEGIYAKDSGVEIGKKLGFTNIIERDAMHYKECTDLVEVDYLCSGNLEGVSFSAFDEDFRGRLVFLGNGGDSIWGRSSHQRNNDWCFMDTSGHTDFSEKRIWLGCVHVPMPLYGAGAWESLYAISNSDEMQPWCLNTKYDRPIPRRIVEEAGIDRNDFGINKHGAGFSYRYDWFDRILKRMSPASAADFKAYVQRNRKPHYIQVVRYFMQTWMVYTNRLKLTKKKTDPRKLCKVPNALGARYLFPWAGEHMIQRYKSALDYQEQ